MNEERFESYLREIVDGYPGGPDYAMQRLVVRILNDEVRDAYPQGADVGFKTWLSDPRATLNDRLEGFEAWINDQCVFNLDYVENSVLVEGPMPPDGVEAEHTLKLILKNSSISLVGF